MLKPRSSETGVVVRLDDEQNEAIERDFRAQ